MKRRCLLILITVCAVSCTQGRSTPPPPEVAELSGTGIEGRYRFVLSLTPNPPVLGELFSVDTRIERLDGKPAEGVEVLVDASMPEHRHGMVTTPKHERIGQGLYRSHGMKFHMPGVWHFLVRAKAADGSDELTLRFQQPAGALP